MPDDLTPDAAAPSETSTPETPQAETPAGGDAVYDNAYQELMTEQAAIDNGEAQEDTEQETTETAQPGKSVLTHGQQQILGRAKLDPSFLAQWPQEQVDQFTEYLRANQAQQDSLGAELARFKQAKPEEEAPEQTKPEPKKPQGKFKERLEAIRAKVVEDYDPSINPLVDAISELDDIYAPILEQHQRHEQVMGPLAGLATEMAIDQILSGLTKEYPSLEKEEARDQVVKRFWTEWNTGAYTGNDKSLMANLRDAVKNSAKVTFNNVTEQAAVANLVTQNKSRLASQPKVGSSRGVQKPKTEDDIYAQAFEETLGPELVTKR